MKYYDELTAAIISEDLVLTEEVLDQIAQDSQFSQT